MSNLTALEEQYKKLGEEIKALNAKPEFTFDQIVEVKDDASDNWRLTRFKRYRADNSYPYKSSDIAGTSAPQASWKYCRPAEGLPLLHKHDGSATCPIPANIQCIRIYPKGVEGDSNNIIIKNSQASYGQWQYVSHYIIIKELLNDYNS